MFLNQKTPAFWTHQKNSQRTDPKRGAGWKCFFDDFKVLLCLNCLLSPARPEHIAASSYHSSTNSFKHCSIFFSSNLSYLSIIFFNSIILCILFPPPIHRRVPPAKFKFFRHFFLKKILSSNLLTNSSKRGSSFLVKNQLFQFCNRTSVFKKSPSIEIEIEYRMFFYLGVPTFAS